MSQQAKLAQNIKMTERAKLHIRLRCGLCNRCVVGTWEEHLVSKEHQFRLRLLKVHVDENIAKYGHDFLVDSTKAVRLEANTEEIISFD